MTPPPPRPLCGVDTGGTFTDVVVDDGRVRKVLSDPGDTASPVRDGLAAFPRPRFVAHGTTVATNALLERKGATVALVTTRGFTDVIEIGRQDRPSLYDLYADRPPPLVDRALRLEVSGRLDAHGAELEPVDGETLPGVPADVACVAVSLLHADLDPRHERVVADELRRRGHEVVCSHEVSPEFREYERTQTTVVNAYLQPVCRAHLRGIADVADEVLVMASGGGLLGLDVAALLPAALLLSGPAGGVRAAAAIASDLGFADVVSFDMGGTSTDVCLIRDGVPEPAAERVVAGFPVRLPSLDIHTIGAGGGSIARIDAGGALAVGPQSAGAWPGPACYGRGGTEPTVTDADLVLGRIASEAAFPGLGALHVDAAAAALRHAGTSAAGVVDVADSAMQQAVRKVSVERGVDPRTLALVAFGGAGPLHACAVAGALDMRAVIVPPRAGVLSAVGLVCSPPQRELVRSWPTPGDRRGLDDARAALAAEATRLLGGGDDVEVETALDCRYAGQSHELRVADVDGFPEEHRRRNGYVPEDAPIEVVALRARAWTAPRLAIGDLPPISTRRPATGPRTVAEPDCTVWVPDGWRAEVADDGSWVITR